MKGVGVCKFSQLEYNTPVNLPELKMTTATTRWIPEPTGKAGNILKFQKTSQNSKEKIYQSKHLNIFIICTYFDEKNQ